MNEKCGKSSTSVNCDTIQLSHENFDRMRVVIKVGTSLIAPGGQIDANLLRAMVDQFDLSKNEYLIVTSGAIAAGMSGLGPPKRPTRGPGTPARRAAGHKQ